MSRFSLLLIVSALMLVVAACDSNGGDDASDDITDDTTTVPTDDATDETNGTNDITIEDDDMTPIDDEEIGDDSATDDGLPAEDDDPATDPADEDATSEDDDVALETEDPLADEGDIPPPDQGDMPDPTQGMFFDLTVDEANEMTEFELREPANVPEALELRTIIGLASMENFEEQDEGEEEAVTIVFSYEQAPEDEMMQGLPVEFTQSTELNMSEGLGPDIDAEQITIGEREVTRIHVTQQAGEEVVVFAWTEDDVHFSLAGILGGDIAEEDLEAMVESVPTM